MRTICVAVAGALLLTARLTGAAEEHIRGVLEKTGKEGACAQITDALNDIYYVVRTPEAQKLCEPLMGQRVMLTGVVEQKQGDTSYFLNLKSASPYQPKLPPGKPETTAPSVPLPPPAEKPNN